MRRFFLAIICLLLMTVSLPLTVIPRTALAKSQSHPTHSTPIPLNQVVQGTFYSNPNNSGTVDFTTATAGVFSQNFPPFIAFNPSPDQQHCTNTTNVDVNTRPFTDVSPNSDGSCTTTIAQSSDGKEQAGVGNLSAFEAKFVAVITLPSAGRLTTNISGDDGWIFCMENENFSGPKPTPDPNNIMSNPPPSHTCPGLGLPEMADNNQQTLAGPTASTIAVNIPVAGNYGIEIDYAECCSGQLTLAVSPFFTQTVDNGSYAGYAATGTQNNPAVYADVTATWTVPTVSCSLGENSQSATWAGLGDNLNDLEQAGTASNCYFGAPQYLAVWQVYQNGQTQGNQLICITCIKGGDNVKLEVQFLSLGQFQFDLWNLSTTNHWSVKASGDTSSKAVALGECIEEEPQGASLSNFGTVTITCSANSQPIGSAGPVIQKYLMDKPSKKAETNDLSAAGLGDSFSVQWVSS